MWKVLQLGEILTLQRGFDLPQKDRIEGKYPIVSSSGITGFHNSYKIEPPGVVTGRYGTLGEVFYIKEKFWPLNTSLYIKSFKNNDPVFISKLLKLVLHSNLNAAGAVPGVNRNHLHKLKIKIPPLPIQRKIAAILSAYDELIDNNNRRIAILEKMAEEIYREWFVRLRFPGHEHVKIVKGVPEGWEVKKLTKIAEITYGKPFDGSKFNTSGNGMPIIRIRNIPNSYTSDFTEELAEDKYLINKGDLLIGMDGDFHINHWMSEKAYLVQRSCRIKAKDKKLEGYLAKAIHSPIKFYESILQGATVGHLGAKHLNSIMILVPSSDIDIGIFNKLLEQKIRYASENNNLKMTRDLLLPRLISGKLDVEHLDIAFPTGMQEMEHTDV